MLLHADWEIWRLIGFSSLAFLIGCFACLAISRRESARPAAADQIKNGWGDDAAAEGGGASGDTAGGAAAAQKIQSLKRPPAGAVAEPETLPARLSDDSGAPLLAAGEKIQALNNTLEQRVRELDTANEELRWLTRELQTARDAAVSAAKTKAQFLSNMSHELRTPLNGLIATTELMLQTKLTAEQQEYASISRESAFALLETVSDLLDFSRIEEGGLSIELIDFDPVKFVEGCAELMSVRARQKNISLMTYVSTDVPATLFGDPARLRQVLLHLLSNAIKFTDRGEVVCRVTLDSLSQARATVRFSVYDTGIGMSKSVQRHLFEPFVQADGSDTRRHNGAGLGLSIARRLVELMGGDIGVQSAEGQGSTFWFSLPLEHRNHTAPKESQAAANLHGLRVLIVDGPQETQKIIQDYACSWDMICATTGTAGEAIAVAGRWHANHKPFDLIIVDYNVSDMHPFTFARYLQNSPDLCATRLILLTSDEEEGRGPRALKCGYSAYLRKPIKQSQLLDCLTGITSMKRAHANSTGSDGTAGDAITAGFDRPS